MAVELPLSNVPTCGYTTKLAVHGGLQTTMDGVTLQIRDLERYGRANKTCVLHISAAVTFAVACHLCGSLSHTIWLCIFIGISVPTASTTTATTAKQ